ncbi:MAG: hypothetical protein ACLPIG_06935 [Methylocella sp.]|jgi:hypothetical protein
MIVRRSFSLVGVTAASILLGLVTFGQTAAQDVRHLCSEKYQAAKAAGTLNGDTWPQFYSKCTAEAKGNAAAQEPAAAPPPPDTRHICSEKYQAAKAGGTLNGETWPQFYSRCTAETKANPPAAVAAPAPAPAPAPVVAAPPAVEPPAPPVAAAPAEEAPPPVAAPAAPVVAPAPANPLKKAPASNKPVAPAVAAAPSTAVFPSAISPAHASEKPGKARLKTCLDQYNANKASNANGGLKWIQKGGGYYSECSKRLRG